MLYDDPQLDPFSIPPDLEGLSRADAIEAIKEWFFENFEDPVQNAPRIDGEYIYMWGGPYETRDIIENVFADAASDDIINAAVSELEREGDQWVPNANRVRDEHEEAVETNPTKLHEEMQRRIQALRNALAHVPEPSAGMGHNRPPEPLDPEPLDANDRTELLTALSVLEAQPIAPSDDGKAAAEAQAKLETKLQKLGKWLAQQGTVFTQEAVKEAGKQFGKWMPTAIWLVVMDRLLGVSEMVTAWLKMIHPPF